MFKRILDFLDDLLNRVTMYRVILYYLLLLFAVSLVYAYFSVLPFNAGALLLSGVFVTVVCWLTNRLFVYVFKAQANVESVFITALILVLIITPPKSLGDFSGIGLLFWASVWAIASKYIFAINKKHIFNPAAFGVALTALTINQSASWWAGGNAALLPFVFLGGFLVVRKLRRTNLVYSFFVAALISVIGLSSSLVSPFLTVWKALLHSPIFFFAFVMLTEPLTTPPTGVRQVLYGIFTGLLFGPNIHLGQIYSTPELALLTGNVFSYLMSPKSKFMLKLRQITQLSPDIYDFTFRSKKNLKFKPGQYLEWTLGHDWPDSRGNRRYFTMASSPTESEVKIGVKFYPNASSFKHALARMAVGEEVLAGQAAGDFTLPRNEKKKLAFIAGGIGITPFRSIIKYLLDRNEHRDIILFYSNRKSEDIVYREIFDEAERKLGIKVFYNLTDLDLIPGSWRGGRGSIDAQMLSREMPDYRERIFYLSGPRSMVVSFEKVLKEMGVKSSHIKTDFFPGFA